MTTAELILGAGVAIMGGGGFWTWFANRGKTRVDLIQLSQNIAANTIEALEARLTKLEDELKEARHEIRGLSQHIVSLEALLIQAGITPPPRPEKKVKA